MRNKNKYLIDTNSYRIAVSVIRKYPENKLQYEAILHESAANDGQPRGDQVGDPVLGKVIRRERLGVSVMAVENALTIIPEEYRDGIMKNIIGYQRFPDSAHLNTWKKYKGRFVRQVARNLGEV